MSIATCKHEVDEGITCTIDDGQIFSDGSKAYSYGTYCWECLKERGVADVHNSEVRKALKENARLLEIIQNLKSNFAFNQSEFLALSKENARLREALEYCLPYLERMFSDIPEKLDPTFYLTLSYDGDIAEAEKIKRFRQILQGKEDG